MTQQESQKIPVRPRTINIFVGDNIPNCDSGDFAFARRENLYGADGSPCREPRATKAARATPTAVREQSISLRE